MSSRILIRKCADSQNAKAIADEIARQAGYPPETIYGIITEKTVCIKKRATDSEAISLKAHYEALGATVVIEPVGDDARPIVQASGASVKPIDDDDDDETPVRLFTDKEYAQRVRDRTDIFYVENNRRAQLTESVSLVCSVLFCLYLGSREPGVTTDFYEPEMESAFLGLDRGPVERPPELRPEVPRQKTVQFTDHKKLQRTKAPGRGGTSGGGGDPRARVAKSGILGMITGQITGTALASAEIFAKGGFATDIDAILQGVNGLKTGGSGGVGRKGEAGIGFGTGVGSGTGGESGLGGIEDLIGGFGGADLALSTPLKTRHTLNIDPSSFATGGALTGGRSKLSISRVVAQNIAALRHAYNKRLREKPGLKGKIVIKFAIDEFGKVIFCKLEETTLTDEILEVAVVDKIKFWKFEKIDKPGDVTEVVYPFIFSQ